MISLQAVSVQLPPGKPGARTILKEISVTVQAGEKIALLGRNGSGKTTLLQTIAGLIPPASGSVVVGRDDTRRQDGPPSMALLLQEADNQFVTGSVRSELLLGLRGAANGDADVERRLEMTAERFDLTGVLGRNPHHLSGGEKQRLAFATIWMAEPDILLLDEPTTHLDSVSRNRCYEFVNTLCGDDSVVVWATPGGEDLMHVDNVLWLEDGEIRYFGSLRDLLADVPLLKSSGILLPPLAALTFRLADSIPGMSGDDCVLEPDGGVASPATTAARVSILAERVRASLGETNGSGVPNGHGRSGSGISIPLRAGGEGVQYSSRDGIVVALNEVSFSYGSSYGSGDALRQLNMRIHEGQCVGITGPNGSGKSTLLSLASGVLQPSRGGIERLYEDAFEAGAQNVFHLFQSPERMFFAETVREEIAFGLRHVHGQKVRLDTFIRRALREANLDPGRVMDRSPVSLSFGEMRRLAFAVFIALRPRFLLLDEPSACLDDSGTGLLRSILHRFVGDGGTVMVASHDVEFLFEVCDRLIYLEEGRVVHDVDISSKYLPEDFAWPSEPQPLILALQEEMSRLGLNVSPRATTIDNFLERLLR